MENSVAIGCQKKRVIYNRIFHFSINTHGDVVPIHYGLISSKQMKIAVHGYLHMTTPTALDHTL